MRLNVPDSPGRSLKYGLYALLVVVVCTSVYVFVILQDGLPTLEQLENPRQDLATQVYSADGELLDHFATTRRTYSPYDSIPPAFVNALVATEDRAFRDHWGVHSFRILKAAVKNVFAMRTKEGASTITQQLARNLYFTQEQTLARKVREAWTALQIERTYTKNEILEMYANTVYYGKGAYGIRVAAQVYFNKEPMRLSISECAYLVGLFKAPERYNNDDSAGIGRRNLILGMMRDAGYIDEARWSKATQEGLAKPGKQEIVRGIAPHFVELIRQALNKQGAWNDRLKGHDLYRDGLVIYTTLNARVQKHVLQAVEEHMSAFQSQFDKSWSWKSNSSLLDELVNRAITKRSDYITSNATIKAEIKNRLRNSKSFVDSIKRLATVIQIGTTVIDPHTGAVLAMVGGSPLGMKLNAAARYSLNHVTQIRRQPGSAFKPFVYAAALENELTPETTIESGPFSMMLPSGDVWSPSGSSKDGLPMSLRTALKFSTNSVAARLITEHTSPQEVIALCRRMGITGTMQPVPSIALGSVEVSPMELINAFAPFVNQGVSVMPSYITRIEDRMGNVLYEARLPVQVGDAISLKTAQSMLSMLRGVVDGGTASGIRRYFRAAAAGKTGTTNDFADAWFVGVTPQLVAGVWTGFDDRRVQFTGDYGQGGRASAPVWGRMMQKIYNDPQLSYKQKDFTIVADSTDVLDPELIINPPSDQISDPKPDTAKAINN